MNKPYIICLKYGTWRNELWFSAPDTEMSEQKWTTAVNMLPEVSERCSSPSKIMD